VRFKKFWEEIRSEFPDVELSEIDATSPEGMELVAQHGIFASPGILINGELFSVGGVNKDAFIAKLREVTGKTASAA
jgi:hypothetical protein